MAAADWTDLGSSLDTASLARGVTAGVAPPPGGGSFVYAFNSKNTNVGAAGKFANATNFAPLAKGGQITAALQRGISGGPTNFSPLLFLCLGGNTVADTGYLLGLSDEDPHRIALVKGKLSDGIPAGAAGTVGILRKSVAAFTPGTWLHVRLDVVVNTNGDVVLKVWQNDLTAHDVASPVWTAVAGMPDYTDDALGINSGSAPLTSGYAGWAMTTKDVSRRAYVDQITLARQV